jgi:hypothetical protein
MAGVSTRLTLIEVIEIGTEVEQNRVKFEGISFFISATAWAYSLGHPAFVVCMPNVV